jgi:XTP/dITP diphosphohydrolase
MHRLDGREILVATHNRGKLAEIAQLIAPFGLTVRSVAHFGFAEPVEDGATFEENAYKKAFTAASATGLPALSDDSGLCIDALDGAPGIHSADWAVGADGRRDFDKAMARVEQCLRNKGAVAEADRRGRFVAVMCLAWPDGHAEYFRGAVEGTLVWPPRGVNGFGYDPIFRPHGHEETFGEMDAARKHGWEAGRGDLGLSHRARAFAAFATARLQLPAGEGGR